MASAAAAATAVRRQQRIVFPARDNFPSVVSCGFWLASVKGERLSQETQDRHVCCCIRERKFLAALLPKATCQNNLTALVLSGKLASVYAKTKLVKTQQRAAGA